MLAFGSCTGEGERSAPQPTVPTTDVETTTTTTTTTATVAPATDAETTTTTAVSVKRPTPSPTTTTRAPSAARKRDRTPVYDANGTPQVTASPRHGGVGTTVHIDGYGFTDAHWMGDHPTLWLAGGDSGCHQYAEAEHTVQVTPDGRLHGDFVVPARGGCRHSGVSEFPIQPGTYAIVYQCTVCTIGTFEVRGSAPPEAAECTTVGFTPQTEDAASSIVAYGLSCDDAEDFVRRVGPSVSPNGPARIELDGWECLLTRHEEEPLPQGFYECTSGSKRITFVRS